MNRKGALIAAAVGTMLTSSSALAVGANFGLFGFADPDARLAMPVLSAEEPSGSAAPTEPAAPEEEVIYVDVPEAAPAGDALLEVSPAAVPDLSPAPPPLTPAGDTQPGEPVGPDPAPPFEAPIPVGTAPAPATDRTAAPATDTVPVVSPPTTTPTTPSATNPTPPAATPAPPATTSTTRPATTSTTRRPTTTTTTEHEDDEHEEDGDEDDERDD